MTHPTGIRPEFYTEEYYLKSCAGHEVFQRSGGRELDTAQRQAIDLAKLRGDEVILDLGSGRGEMLIACGLRGCQAWGIDYSPAAVDIARRTIAGVPEVVGRIRVEHMDVREIRLPSAQFDVVFVMDLVEHIPQNDLVGVMTRIRDVLRPGGRLIIHTGPTLNFLRVGQHVKRVLYRLRGRETPPRLTRESQFRDAGHCNLQSHKSLTEILTAFDEARVWYQFSEGNGTMYRWAARTGLTPLLAFNLWAVATRKA
jgi:SAM-dependent methyltransferase